MDAELVLLMNDEETEIVVRKISTYFRFTVRPKHTASTMANTRHYAFADEAIKALQNLGYSDAGEVVEEAIRKLTDSPPAIGL